MTGCSQNQKAVRTVKWFQNDSDAPNDPKVKAAMRQGTALVNGNLMASQAVAGAIWLLWCYVAAHGEGVPGLGVKEDGSPLDLAEMADECLFDDEGQLMRLLDYLAEKKHIDPDQWRGGVVFLPAMKKRADEYAKRKGRAVPAAGESGGLFPRIPPEVPLQDKTLQHTTENQTDTGLLQAAGPDQVDALVAIWNEDRKPGPKVGHVNPTRRRAILKAMKAHPDLTEWRRLIAWINGQPWMNAQGTGNHPKWRAELDFVCKPGKVDQLLDRMKADRGAVRADGTEGRNATKGRTGFKRGEFAAALSADDDATTTKAIH